VNARDAMQAGGRLLIETGNVHLDEEFGSLRPGRYVVMSVTDTGHGMDQATIGRIFEPFFTTKEPGKGTGLGLSLVYGIVEQSGGTVTVDSTPGSGTTFRVYLPAYSAAGSQEAAEETTESEEAGTGTILLVEDEAPLRKLMSTLLADAGHQVLEAANGDEAVALALTHPHIDLLVTDVVMPGLGGPDLAARLRTSRPELAVLYVSGYDLDSPDRQKGGSPAEWLSKPFAPAELVARVGAKLAAGRRNTADGRNGSSQ
jgi:CheY-like chemotaxis protein